MSTKTNFRNLLVKLSSIYSTDFYIIHNQYIMAGDKSEENNSGYYICELSLDMISICKELFEPDRIYYIKHIKNAKDNLNDNIVLIDKNKEKDIMNKFNKYHSLLSSITSWSSLSLSDDEIKKIFTENLSIELFENNKDIPTVTISKSLIPMITDKKINDLYYTTKKDNEIYYLFLSYNSDYFRLDMIYNYIPIDE